MNMTEALTALGEFLAAMTATHGILFFGWILAGVFFYALYKQDSTHKERMDLLHKRVSDLQDLRVSDANENKDEFVTLTERVLTAIESFGGKKK